MAAIAAACGGSSSNTLTAPSATTRCAVNLQAVTTSVPSEGGSGAVTIAVNRECAWEASADVDWMAITPPRAGQGNATLGFTVSSNPQPSVRRGRLIVNDSRVEVTQAGVACTLTLDSAFGTVGAEGGPLRVAVAGLSGCPWTAVSQASWIRVVSGGAGDGAGAVVFEIEANPGEPRTGTVAIAGQVYTVAQGSAPAPTPPTPPVPGCSFTVGPSTLTLPAGGGTAAVNVVAPAGCAWTSTSTAGWLTFAGPGAGQGPGSVTVSAPANPANAVRTGSVVVAGRPVLVVQDAAPAPTPPVVNCSYTVGPATQTVPAGGGTTIVNVAAPSSCAWTATSTASWLVVLSGASGGGSGNVSVSAAANPSSTARTGSVIVAGQTVQIVQEGTVSSPNPSCTHEVTPLAVSVGAAATTTTLTVTSSAASCAWTAVSGVPWITVNAPGGSGNGQLPLAIATNEGTSARTGAVTVAGKTVQVTQAGMAEPAPTCTFTVVPTAQTLDAAAGSGQVAVNASAATCGWTATSGAPWITVVSGATGTGSGAVTWQVTANEAASPRTGTLTVAGQVVTLTQPGTTPPACTYQLTPPAITIGAEGGPATTHVETAAACTWSAASQVNWITVTSAPSGTGAADVQISVAANTDTAARTGAVVIGGQLLQVGQAGAPAPPACSFSVAPTSQAVAADGGAGQVAVTASASTCAWTATSAVPWITVTSGAGGTGSGAVAYQVAANDTTTARTGTLSVAGQVVTVSQPGKEPAPCTYQLTPSSVSVPALGGEAVTQLETAAHCPWTAVSQATWISVVSAASGTGSAAVQVLASANPGTTARTGTVSIGGQTLQVTQPGTAGTVVAFNGNVASSSGTCPNLAFKVKGQEIVTDSATTFEGGPCTLVTNGVMVTGDGLLQQNGTVRATRVVVSP